MNVRHVAYGPNQAVLDAGNPVLPPELVASVLAKYSRTDVGLDGILAELDLGNESAIWDQIRTVFDNWVDPDYVEDDLVETQQVLIDLYQSIKAPDYEKTIDRIFKHVDYGHRSIQDLAWYPICMDGLSMSLVAVIWNLTTFGAGQELSSRFSKFNANGLQDPTLLGVPLDLRVDWAVAMDQAFQHYSDAVALWESVLEEHPEAARIPSAWLTDPTKRKTVDRMKRNFAFDRGRIFLPLAVKTNLALVLPETGWARLVSLLASHPLQEAQQLAELLRGELALCAPRCLRHAHRDDTLVDYWDNELSHWENLSWLMPSLSNTECPVTAHLSVSVEGWDNESEVPNCAVITPNLVHAFDGHKHRYLPLGSPVDEIAVQYGWNAISLAELRDVQRHRVGKRKWRLVPRGFHTTLDEMARIMGVDSEQYKKLKNLSHFGFEMATRVDDQLREHDPGFLAWALMGLQCDFRHWATADQMIYECELRTGPGAHYRYAQHYRDLLQLWYDEFPETKGLILEGSAEPE